MLERKKKKRKKSVSKIGATRCIHRRYLPMTQKSGILKDRRICVQKTGSLTRCRPSLASPPPRPFKLFRVNGFFSVRFSRFFFFFPLCTIPCDLQKSSEYAGYASYPPLLSYSSRPIDFYVRIHIFIYVYTRSTVECADLPESRENLPASRYAFATTTP